MEQPLWPGGPTLDLAPGVFPLSTDSVLLADFAAPGPRDRVLDLGTGSGILLLLLGWQRPGLSLTGVELDQGAAQLARENLKHNALAGQILLGDLRDRLVPPGGFDLVVSNPPYFAQDSGKVARGTLATARSDSTCALSELCHAAALATRWGGRFCLVFRPERMAELFQALGEHGFTPKRLCPVHHSPGKAVNLILLEARRGGNPGLRWEPDLYLRDEAGNETDAVRRIYHKE